MKNEANSKARTIAVIGTSVADVALGEPAQFRMVLISFLAAGVGLIAG